MEQLMTFINQIYNWSIHITEQTQGILIGSGFTLIGVWFTNRGNLRNLRQQLSHDRDQKKIEYELGIRRDVYLGVAQSVSEGMSALSRLADLSITNEEAVKQVRENSSQIAKLHIVAKQETALAFLEFIREFSKSMLRISLARRPVQAIKDQMASHLQRMHRHNSNRDQTLELIKQMTQSGIRDDVKFKLLSDAFEFEQQQANLAAKAHDDLLEQLKPAHMTLFKATLDEQRGLYKTLTPALSNIREELGMPIDAIKYERALTLSDGFDEEMLQKMFYLNTQKN